MDRRRIILIALVVALLVIATGTAVVYVKAGAALLSFTVTNGVVKESPAQVASACSAKLGRTVSVEVAALATVIDSEAAGEPLAVRQCVGYAVLNKAGRSRSRIVATIAPKGKLGAQNAGNTYVSSARPPTSGGIDVAEAVLAGTAPDYTRGATQFDSPKAQRAALARGTKGYTKTPEEVADGRRAEGKTLVLVPGVPEERFRMWTSRAVA